VQANGDVAAVRVLGLLLFGREESLRRLLPTHEVAFQVLSGRRVEVNDFFRWPLLRVVDELLARFRARNREEEALVGMLRIGLPDYSPAAFREGMANALIHRDYTRLGAVHVQWREDRLEIANPGGFPEGVRLDNLLVTQPRPRNPLLADAFKRAGIVERTARSPTSTTSVQRRQLDLCILPSPAVVVAGGLWETRSVFQGVWEGAGGREGAAAFHTPAGHRPG
jgi:ATP-dependent DNA helicase RecG